MKSRTANELNCAILRVTDNVDAPFAIVTFVYADGTRLAIRDHIMRYKPETGWTLSVDEQKKRR